MIFTPAQDAAIRQTIRSCGQQAKQLAAQNYEVFQKAPGDFVTSVDQALDRQLAEFFSNLFPDDGIITEENAASRKRYQSNYSRLWCIDPLDGTGDFIQGHPDYGVLVGLLKEKQPMAGWVYAPEQDAMYYGGLNLGVWQAKGATDPQPCEIAEVQPRSRYRVILGDKDYKNVATAIRTSLPEIQFVRAPGSFGLKVVNVILGKVDLYVYLNRRVKIWDTVAPIALAQAAGLTCCDLDGQPIRYDADALDLDTLAHQQPILIGWGAYIESLLPRLRKAIPSYD